MFMMKKWMKIFSLVIIILVILLCAGVLLDRHKHIENDGVWEEKTIVWMHDSFFVDIPCESGLDLREEGLKPVFAWLYADSVHPLLKTLKNPVPYYTEWITYEDSGQPMFVHVIEKNDSSPQTMVISLEEASVFTTIDGIEVAYNEPAGMNPYEQSFMLHLQNGDRIIQLQFAYTLLDELMPVLDKAWNKIREYGE